MISLVEVEVYRIDGDPYDDDIAKDGIGLIPVGAIGAMSQEIESGAWGTLSDVLAHFDWRKLYNDGLEWRLTQRVTLAFDVTYPPASSATFGCNDDADIEFIGTCDPRQWTADALNIRQLQEATK